MARNDLWLRRGGANLWVDGGIGRPVQAGRWRVCQNWDVSDVSDAVCTVCGLLCRIDVMAALFESVEMMRQCTHLDVMVCIRCLSLHLPSSCRTLNLTRLPLARRACLSLATTALLSILRRRY